MAGIIIIIVIVIIAIICIKRFCIKRSRVAFLIEEDYSHLNVDENTALLVQTEPMKSESVRLKERENERLQQETEERSKYVAM